MISSEQGIGSYQPIVIIGAPRSGTNMLRDVICSLSGFATWPCDEINPVWKHGHLRYAYDDLRADWATPERERFVRRRFDWVAHKYQAGTVVEKTCANSLRVAYVSRLLPEARFVFIYRHGAYAAASAAKRWRSSVNLAYTLRKLRFVPLADIASYGARFIKNRIKQVFDPQRRLHAWGPMTAEIEAMAAVGDIEAAAALQWRQCVDCALDQFPGGAPAASVCYEQFVAEPATQTRRLMHALGYTLTASEIEAAVTTVRPDRRAEDQVWPARTKRADELQAILAPGMDRLGYGPSLANVV